MSFHGRRYLRSLGSGYLVMGLQIVYGLAVIPLVLRYLGTESFGVWALALQVSTWLLMIDAGMTAGISRFFIDHQGDPHSEACGVCISTAFRLLCMQGLAVVAGTLLLAWLIPGLAGLEGVQVDDFRWVMIVLGLMTGFGFLSKIGGAWLYASQRLESANWLAFAGVALEWASLVWMLNASWGLPSLAYSRVINVLVNGIGTWLVAARSADFPWRRIAGKWHPEVFRELAKFGSGIFAFTVAAQALNASQTFLVTKFHGVGEAAVWGTAPKLFLTAQMVVARIGDFALPGLLLLVTKGSLDAARGNLIGTLRTTAHLAMIGGAVAAVLNPSFLFAWTGGQIAWSGLSDGLMVGLVVSSLVVKTFTDVVVHSKKLGALPWVFALESVAFLAAACLLLPRFGIPGMLMASLVTSLAIRLPYVGWRTGLYLGFTATDWARLTRAAILAAAAGCVAAASTHLILLSGNRQVSWWLIGVAGVAGSLPALPIVWQLFRTHSSKPI